MIYTFSSKMNIPPHDFLNMFFYEILILLDIYKEAQEEENKQIESQNKSTEKEMSGMKNNFNPNNFKMPEFKMPEFKAPNFNM